MKKTCLIKLLLFFLITGMLHAQESPNAMLHGVYSKIQEAKDYSADAHITVDIPFIRILPINAKIFFKQKDKFRVITKSIAVLPRQGFDQASKNLADTNSFTSILQGKEMLGSTETYLINVIPNADTNDLILGKFWIDPGKNIILKSQLTTKSSGTILIEYFYGEEITYGLPDKIVFTIDSKKFKLPKGMTLETGKPSGKEGNSNEKKKGQIIILLSNYQVNKGISDEVFEK